MANCTELKEAVALAQDERVAAYEEYRSALADGGINIQHYWHAYRDAMQHLAMLRTKLRQCLANKIIDKRKINPEDLAALESLSDKSADKVACPYCIEPIHPNASKCPHCQSMLDGTPQSGGGCGCQPSRGTAAGDAALSSDWSLGDEEAMLKGFQPGIPGDPNPCGRETSWTNVGLVIVAGRLRCRFRVCGKRIGPLGRCVPYCYDVDRPFRECLINPDLTNGNGSLGFG